MDVLGIDEITYGADDLPDCRTFFLDWGLVLADGMSDLALPIRVDVHDVDAVGDVGDTGGDA